MCEYFTHSKWCFLVIFHRFWFNYQRGMHPRFVSRLHFWVRRASWPRPRRARRWPAAPCASQLFEVTHKNWGKRTAVRYWLVVYVYPSEKYESQLGWWLFPIIIWKNNIHVPNHQPVLDMFFFFKWVKGWQWDISMIYSWWSEHVGWSIQIFGNSTFSCLGFQWIDQKKKQCFMAETHEEIRAFCPFNHFKKVKCWAKWQHWHMN